MSYRQISPRRAKAWCRSAATTSSGYYRTERHSKSAGATVRDIPEWTAGDLRPPLTLNLYFPLLESLQALTMVFELFSSHLDDVL